MITQNKIIHHIIFMLVCTIVFFVLLEVTVRIFVYVPPKFIQYNEACGSTLKPNTHGIFKREGFSHVKINSKGLRDYEYSFEKPENVFRILIVGDSFVTAFQVELVQTFHKILERLLNESNLFNKKIEVINVSQPNYGTAEEYLRLKYDGLKYEPDMIILAFYNGNDFRNNSPLLDKNVRPFFVLHNGQLELDDSFKIEKQYQGAIIGYNNPLRNLSRTLAEHSDFYRFVRIRIDLLKLQIQNYLVKKNNKGQWVPVDYQLYFSKSDERWQGAFAVTDSLILEIKKLTLEHGIQFLLVSIPSGEQVYDEARLALIQNYPWVQNWDFEKPEKILRELCQENNIEYFELLPIFKKVAQESEDIVYFNHNGHLTSIGHKILANELFNLLVQNNSYLSDVNLFN